MHPSGPPLCVGPGLPSLYSSGLLAAAAAWATHASHSILNHHSRLGRPASRGQCSALLCLHSLERPWAPPPTPVEGEGGVSGRGREGGREGVNQVYQQV